MIPVNDIYKDCEDKISPAENGTFNFERFNRLSWIAQLSLIDWLSGDVSNVKPPQPYLSQKNKDWLSGLIIKKSGNVDNGFIDKPADYYQWDNGYVLGSKESADCEEDEENPEICNTPITILNGAQFAQRCITDIDELKPSNAPICKEVGSKFEFRPKDLGSVEIEYIRYPVKAVIGTKIDPVYNEQVYDPATSTDFEWPEFARQILVWFIVNQFSDNTREKALKETNIATGKTVRDGVGS